MKAYTDNPPIGKVKHSVSFHDGEKKHKDGSPFFDLRTFKRGRDKETFVKRLEKEGYVTQPATPNP